MLPDRFWNKVDKTAECWVWRGRWHRGYGHFSIAGKAKPAHRVAYEDAIGPIPEGLTIDHLCRVRACVNPAHLEPVDMRTNILRGTSPTAKNAVKTACKRGHPLVEANVYRSRKGRECRTCRALGRYVKARALLEALDAP